MLVMLLVMRHQNLNKIMYDCTWQGFGSWSSAACCSDTRNSCTGSGGAQYCRNKVATSNFVFSLSPGTPRRFRAATSAGDGYQPGYQLAKSSLWPTFGGIGAQSSSRIVASLRLSGGTVRYPTTNQLGSGASCGISPSYTSSANTICGGSGNWGTTNMEVWYDPSQE